MAEAKRAESSRITDAQGRPTRTAEYDPGGDVGALHSELARRLLVGSDEANVAPESAQERVIRALSTVAGYASLAGGVALVWMLMF